MTTLLKDLQWRYAVKKFDSNKKLTTTQIDLLKNTFNLTPTSYGLQPIRLLVISNDTLKQQLQVYAYNQIQISTCSHLLVLCSQTDFGAKDIDRFVALNIGAMPDKKNYYTTYGKTLKKRFAQKSQSDIQRWADDQSFIALGNLIDVCASAHIDSCPMSGFDPEAFDTILGLKELNLTAVSLLPVGYRAHDDLHQFDPKIRRPLNEMIVEIT